MKDALLITLSKTISLSFKEWSSKRVVLYNGIKDPLIEFKLNLREQKIKSSKIKLIFCSNLFKYKGINDLIDISDELKSRKIDFILTIVGAEGDFSSAKLNEIIKNKGLESEIKYVGPKYGVDKTKLFLESDLFIYPTYYDSLPIVLIESLACGLPIVSYDVGGINEILNFNECGSIISRGKFDLVTEEIVKYSSDEKILSAKAKNSRKRFESHFSIQTFEQNIIDILKMREK